MARFSEKIKEDKVSDVGGALASELESLGSEI